MFTMKSSTQVLLYPWRNVFASFELTRLERDDTAVLTLNVKANTTYVSTPLREAMDLLHLAVALDGSVLRDMVMDAWVPTAMSSDKSDRHNKLLHLPGCNIHRLEFVVAHDGFVLDPLKRALDAIFRPISNAPDPENAEVSGYQAARHALVQRITENGRLHALNERIPVSWCIRMRATTASHNSQYQTFEYCVAQATSLRVHDFFRQLAGLACDLRGYQTSDQQSDGVYFSREPLRLSLDAPLSITPYVARMVEECMCASDGYVECSSVVLDPRLISCAAVDITAFLCALSRGSSGGLAIEMGLLQEYSNVIDRNGNDYAELIGVLLQGIGGCAALTSVDLSPLLRLFEQPHNREGIWNGLFDGLLLRVDASPIGKLSFQVGTSINDADVRCIAKIAKRGGVQHPRRAVGCLRLDVTMIRDNGLVTLVGALHGVHTLEVRVREEKVKDKTMAKILQHTPTLRELRVVRARIDSMAAFTSLRTGKCGCCEPAKKGCEPALLEVLELHQSTLTAKHSLVAFFQSLGDPTSTIARSLRSLVISDQQPTSDFVLGTDAAMALEQALHTNRRLHTIDVSLTKEVPLAVATALSSHMGQEIVVTTPTPVYKQRKLAFLSVLSTTERGGCGALAVLGRLDATVIHEIFACMGPTAPRVVRAEYVVV